MRRKCAGRLPEDGFWLDICLCERLDRDLILNAEPRVAVPLAECIRQSGRGPPTLAPEVILFLVDDVHRHEEPPAHFSHMRGLRRAAPAAHGRAAAVAAGGGHAEMWGSIRVVKGSCDVRSVGCWSCAPRVELVEALELACRVGKIARALTWNRVLTTPGGEDIDEEWRAPRSRRWPLF